ncbi:MAG: ImmA/IrrE family metallo-endopeptidase [Melioribacteraceae bacterium]|nr:ImmA/IrrE family metallo-endopeptidase [Melioribacteraceae bacterium]
MMNRVLLSKNAYYSSVKLRKRIGLPLDVPIPIYDIVENYGIDVRFLDTKSIEGMYSKTPGPAILIGAYRPKGRQTFTCAHELAHHIFDHGSKIDEIKEYKIQDSEEEFLADCFAGYFLIPPFAINYIVKLKKWSLSKLTPIQTLYLSNYFGVGYTTIINHLCYSLKLISTDKLRELVSHSKKNIYNQLTQMTISSDLLIIDNCHKINMDVNVGDFVYTPKDIFYEGINLSLENILSDGNLYKAVSVGISRFTNNQNDWAKYCRISKKDFVGRNKYKHLGEADDA